MKPFVTNEACINRLVVMQAGLAACKVRLVQDTISGIDATTTKADLVTNEATYTGYLALVIAALPAPYLVPGNGANLQAPSQQFQPTGTAVQNRIRGWWVELATGEIWLAGQFDADLPMGDTTNAIPLIVIFNQANQ